MRGKPHHFALVAFARKNRLCQQEVEHPEPDQASLVTVPQLLADAFDPLSICLIERRDFTPVRRHAVRAAPFLGEFGNRAALPIDDHHGCLFKWRRMEYAVDMREMVRDALTLAVWREFQCL